MQKVTLKYEYNGEYESPKTYTIEFNSDGMTLEEFLDEVKRFTLMMGYHPEVVANAFPEE